MQIMQNNLNKIIEEQKQEIQILKKVLGIFRKEEEKISVVQDKKMLKELDNQLNNKK